MRVTVLVENTSGPLAAVAPEFGLSLLIEAEAATVFTGHCTGARAVGVLQAELGPRLKVLHTGMQFEL